MDHKIKKVKKPKKANIFSFFCVSNNKKSMAGACWCGIGKDQKIKISWIVERSWDWNIVYTESIHNVIEEQKAHSYYEVLAAQVY